mgnify:FL=1
MSARSIDEVNVQIIAEKLGGGGHINPQEHSLTIQILKRRLMHSKKRLIK